jgi:hypothetical protein
MRQRQCQHEGCMEEKAGERVGGVRGEQSPLRKLYLYESLCSQPCFKTATPLAWGRAICSSFPSV